VLAAVTSSCGQPVPMIRMASNAIRFMMATC
jgi:hypothetical protein